MRQRHRFLVQWRSSVTGKHSETFMHEQRARDRLEEVRDREYFERGAVVDTQTQSPAEFKQKHDHYHQQRTSP